MISDTCLSPTAAAAALSASPPRKTRVRAVGLLSGGLDSTLAALVMRDLGVDVYGLCFILPWGCCNKDDAHRMARSLGIRFLALQLDESYLEMIKKPKYGRGRALNPCVDCRIHMFSRARKYMEQVDADFVFTGEVLGQRPMSQMRRSLAIIERDTGLQGKLLRPLSARLLEPTLAEEKGLIDRSRLLGVVGRSRSEQMTMAEANGIRDYPTPAGGCLLTDRNFSKKMSDLLEHGYRNFREAVTLKWGRHFRLSRTHKAVLGRNESENEILRRFAQQDDTVMELEDRRGPTVIIQGPSPDSGTLGLSAGLLQHYSRYRGTKSVDVEYWTPKNPHHIEIAVSTFVSEDTVSRLRV